MYYKLDENKKVIPSSIEEWSDFIIKEFPTNYTRVGNDIIDGNLISTVFIGLSYAYSIHSGNPIVFETMIFDKNNHGFYQEKYSTWKEAEEGHKKAIEWVKNGCKDDGLINE